MIRRRALLVMLSDFLTPLDELEREIGLLTAMQHDVVIFHVMDPAELEFPFDESAAFADSESGRKVLLEPAMVRKSYLARLQAHMDRLRKLCERHGVEYRLIRTDRPLEEDLFDFLSARRNLTARHRARPMHAA
jgi:uncharacterized protein (DUF58 family)